MGELAGQLSSGLLGGFQVLGELVQGGGEGGELGTLPGIDDAGMQAAVSQEADSRRRVGDGRCESFRDEPADGYAGEPCDEDAHPERDEDGLVECPGDVLLDEGVRNGLDGLEVGLEDRRADQQSRDQDRAGPGDDDQHVVEQESGGQAQPGQPRRVARHPGPIR